MNPLTSELSGYLSILALLILAGACSSKLSSRLNMPVLLLFLAVGMLAGPDMFGLVVFKNVDAANILGCLAMALILFSGGYDTSWKSVRKVIGYGSSLSCLGTLLTALFVGLFTYLLFEVGFLYFPGLLGFTQKPSLEWCLLLGAVISTTDDAAVFAILRNRRVSLPGNLRTLLEYESGSNDPMAAFLTIFMVGMIRTPGEGYWTILPMFLYEIGGGLICGWIIAHVSIRLLRRIDLELDGLYYVISFCIVLLTFGASQFIHGNGYVAVFTCGIIMGNSRFAFRHRIGRFHDGIGWLMQVMLFGLLGLLSFPKQLPEVTVPGVAVTAFMIFAARPLAVFIAMIGSRFTFREKLFVSWVGIRGAAPIILATFPLMANVPDAWKLFNIVFIVVLVSVLIQGWTLMPLARLLKLDRPYKAAPRVPIEFENTGTMDGEMHEFEIPPGAPCIGETVSRLELPKGTLILLIRRGHQFIVPHGSTVIETHDGLMILAEPKALKATSKLLHCAPKDSVPQST